jgi:two-component system nitrogen regulation response regulator NtrX
MKRRCLGMLFDTYMVQQEKSGLASVKKNNAKKTTKSRLLLVESNDLIRDIFTQLFKRSGYYTVAVEKGKNGSETLKNECFDIVICDFDLHDSTGVEFFESAKNICPERINILMITPGDPVNVYEIKKLNIRHIIEKPFPFDELLRIVEGTFKS